MPLSLDIPPQKRGLRPSRRIQTMSKDARNLLNSIGEERMKNRTPSSLSMKHSLTLQPSEEEIALPRPLEFTSGSLTKSIDQTQMCMAERLSLLARLCPKIPLADWLSDKGHHPKKRKLEDQISSPPLLVQENMKTTGLHQQSGIRLMNHSSLGSEKEKSMLSLSRQVSRKLSNRLTITPGTPSESLNTSSPLLDVHPSPRASGSTSSSGSTSTSGKFSKPLILSSSIPNSPTLSTTKLNCPSKPLNPPYPLKLGQNLVQPSPCSSRPLPLSSPSAGKSSPSTKISSQRCLSPTSPLSTYRSSSLTKLSETKSQPNDISASLILPNLTPFG